MKALLALSHIVDRINEFLGRAIAWLILAAVLVSAGNAIIRKAFDMSSNAWLELQWYLYGAVFLVAAAYTLQRNEHVRIDFVSNLLSKRVRDWIELFGHVFFLLPFTGLMVYLAWPWFWRSFNSAEISPNAGGLILWPAKIMVLIGFVLLTAQALSEIIKRIAILRGDIEETYPGHDLPPIIEELETGVDLKSEGGK